MLNFTLNEIALTIVGVILSSIVTYFTTKYSEKKKGLCYAVSNSALYSHDWVPHEDFQLSFRGERVKRPKRAIIYLWNDREVIVDRADFTTLDPLRYEGADLQILQIGDVASTRNAVNGRAFVNSEKTGIFLDFDFMDQNDGMRVEIFYDTSTGREANAKMLGAIKGVRGEPRHEEYKFRKNIHYKNYLFSSAAFLACSAALLIFGFSETLPLLAFLFAFLIVGDAMEYLTVRKRNKIPFELSSDKDAKNDML